MTISIENQFLGECVERGELFSAICRTPLLERVTTSHPPSSLGKLSPLGKFSGGYGSYDSFPEEVR